MPEPLPTPPTWAPGPVRTRPGPVPRPSSATSPDLDQATLRHSAGPPASTRPVRPAAPDTPGPPAPGTPGHTSSVLTCAESSCVESAPSSISRAVHGEPPPVIRPDTIPPRTPTETLQKILARDEAPLSASTLLRELNNPAARLFQAVQRYTDSLHVAAEQLLGPQTV